MYSLDAFADGSPISQDFLRKLQHDLEAAKQAGWSLVLRFLYINASKLFMMKNDNTRQKMFYFLNLGPTNGKVTIIIYNI